MGMADIEKLKCKSGVCEVMVAEFEPYGKQICKLVTRRCPRTGWSKENGCGRCVQQGRYMTLSVCLLETC